MRVDGFIHAYDCREAVETQRAIDVDPLPPRIAANFFVLATLYPAVGGDGVVLWMGAIHKVNGVVGALAFLQFFVEFDEVTLSVGVGLAGHEFRYFVDKPETVQQFGHATHGVVNRICRADVSDNGADILVQRVLQMRGQTGLLFHAK